MSTQMIEAAVYFVGAVNSAFSETSLTSSSIESRDSLPHNDTYLQPQCVPRINIIQPSLRKPRLSAGTGDNATDVLPHMQMYNSSPRRVELVASRLNETHCVNIDECQEYLNQGEIQDEEIRFRNLQKLLMEGPTQNGVRRQSYDSSQTVYETLRKTRVESNAYKSLTTLALPPIDYRKPRKSNDSAKHSDHTYESINTELSSELLRGGREEFDDDVLQDQDEIPVNTNNRLYNDNEGLNDLNKSPDHTYESVRAEQTSDVPRTPDLSVVIIGRRKQSFYGSIRSNHKFGNPAHLDNFGSEVKRSNVDPSDRYSPFPSSKKLAIKSSFKPVPSPRFPMIDTISGSVTPYRIPDCLCTMGQTGRRFSVENANVNTPEITVTDRPTVFMSPKKQYFHPMSGMKEQKPQPFISPLCTYQTLKAQLNLLSRDNSDTTPNRRSSLPSISDQLGREIKDHCDLNQFSSSTPFLAV